MLLAIYGQHPMQSHVDLYLICIEATSHYIYQQMVQAAERKILTP